MDIPLAVVLLRDDFHRENFARVCVFDPHYVRDPSLSKTTDDHQGIVFDAQVAGGGVICFSRF